ncbi:DUF402 domain-containing protein [Herbidospora solisilvae]|uniref:DUF402 domain-containing protein n=1 Tax=Herbidospora solisilvae TaxID=2696284 RepID=UPI002E28BEF9|nr:DUF402 domain-containing protein [Herbidospora solisilvae]
MTDLAIVYRKYDESLHWNFPGVLLGEDEHGVWTGHRKGIVGRKGHEPKFVYDFPFVMLFPRNAWWTASFNAYPHQTEVYVDVTTVPVVSDVDITMIDLDLDVIRKTDGRIFLDDADEFQEHQVRFGYPPDVVEQAERAAEWLMDAVTERREPFGRVHRGWLDKLEGLVTR